MCFILCIYTIPEQEFGLDYLSKGSPEFSVQAFMIYIINHISFYDRYH